MVAKFAVSNYVKYFHSVFGWVSNRTPKFPNFQDSDIFGIFFLSIFFLVSPHQIMTATAATSELTFKINLVDKGASLTMRLEANITVEDCISRVLRKNPIKNPSSYGMFLFTPEGKYFLLDESLTLTECRLKDNVCSLKHQK